MKTQLSLIIVAGLIAGCSSTDSRYETSMATIDLGGGQYLVSDSSLEAAQDKAKNLCRSKGKEVLQTRTLVQEFNTTKVSVVCK